MDPLNEAPTDDAPLSMSEAIAAYTSQPTDEADDGQSDDDAGEQGDTLETDDEAQEGDEAGEEQPDDEGQPDDEDAEGDENEEQDDDTTEVGGGRFAADDAKVRMPDGTFLTIAQLKSGNLMDRDYRQKTMAVAEEKKALESQVAAVTQTKQQLTEQQEYMATLLQSLMPEAPKRPTASSATDPFAWVQYQEQQEAYNNFVQHLQYIQQQQDGSKQELTAKQQAERDGRINSEFAALLEKAPELKDQQKLASFEADMIATGAEYGFTREDIAAQVPNDHRMALVLRDAMAWRKLQARKTTPQDKNPAPKRPPVQKGGKRLNPGNIQARQVKQSMDRLEKSGSIKDGVAAYLALQKQG